MSDPARDAVERHAQAINERDVTAYRPTLHYPFTYQNDNGVALTIEAATDVGTTAPPPWEIILRTDPEWHHTEFDAVTEVARSATSAVFHVTFRRVDTAGRASRAYHAIWIATCRDGKWGIQFRHNLGICEP